LNIEPPRRTRVLLADDNVAVLESVSRYLAAAFDVVGLAGGGRQALDLASRLRPEVLVLDVSMPDLGGFQTLEQLRPVAPDTRVVFLTMHKDDDIAASAIDHGACGYVLKSRTHLDLISAIDNAVAGRLFLPSLTSLSRVAGHQHAVQVHGDDRRFLDDVGQFVAATLRSGEPIVILADDATRVGIAERLQARQMNVLMLAAQGQYVALDSALSLSQAMHDGQPDAERLAEIVHGLDRLRLAFPNGPRHRLTIWGDLSASLCRSGQVAAALELERIWSELTRSLPFFTVCSYSSHCFEHAAARHQLPNVCAQHSAVIAEHHAAPVSGNRGGL
jgi:DNA-binding NarL/FixJ family response regulator